jgi:prepilin-type N-terminal cleavage/methylation domain-containing protein
MKKHSNGFTLIELLVVIAIIGILASVVLASLNTARAKGADAKIKSNMASARTQAALFYDSNGSRYDYGNSDTTDVCYQYSVGGVEGINKFLVSAVAQYSSTAVLRTPDTNPTSVTDGVCNSDVGGQMWAAEVPLKEGGYYCVDYMGASQRNTTRGLANYLDYSCN